MEISTILQSLVDRGCPNLTELMQPVGYNTKLVGRGGFGNVYSATLRNGVAVAVKIITKPPLDSLADMKKQFKRTVRELYAWNKCRHPGVLNLLGMVELDNQRVAMVSPLLSNGPILEYIRAHPELNRIRLCVQLAETVEFLHSRGIVHGDIKAHNVLMSDTGDPLLGDFGSAWFNFETSLPFTPTTSVTATQRYAAPEILDQISPPTPESDIYAFGMMTLEIVTGMIPFAEIEVIARVIIAVLVHKKTPKRPDLSHLFKNKSLEDDFWALLNLSWSHDPKQRPSATQLKNALREFCL